METGKQKLRAELKESRLARPAEEVNTKSRVISDFLIGAVDWAEIKGMHIYSDVSDWKEVQTRPIIEYLRSRWPEIEIFVASVSPKQQPPNQRFNLIVVPCLGFDKNLYRLGLGAGFYDRFLAGQPKALKIGLAYANDLVKPGLPREPHDIPLDAIITEEGIIKAHGS